MERPPISPTAGEPDPDRLVEIASFPYPLEAHLAAARLRTEGVTVSLSGEHTAGLLSGVDCVRLWVRAGDRARAVESLTSLSPRTAAPRRSRHFVTGDLHATRCPRCGGLAVERERMYGPIGELLWRLFWAARPLLGSRLRCRLCKARWKPVLGDQGP